MDGVYHPHGRPLVAKAGHIRDAGGGGEEGAGWEGEEVDRLSGKRRSRVWHPQGLEKNSAGCRGLGAICTKEGREVMAKWKKTGKGAVKTHQEWRREELNDKCDDDPSLINVK